MYFSHCMDGCYFNNFRVSKKLTLIQRCNYILFYHRISDITET